VTFSLILESCCILPQLLLLRQTTVPTVLDSFYLLTLGSYRAFYILNWIWREADPNDRRVEPIPIIFGIIQTAFYIDFAWVYYSRQRVKLRRGGIVDSDDIRRGWLLRSVFGNKAVVGSVDEDEDEESSPALGNGNSNGRPSAPPRTESRAKWGARGISVQADDSVLAAERQRQNGFKGQEQGVIDTRREGNEFLDEDGDDDDAKMKDPDELAKILDDEDEDDGSDDGVLRAADSSGVSNGSEWRDGRK
jgi:hypothetical protein